jgi:hypothetical protein
MGEESLVQDYASVELGSNGQTHELGLIGNFGFLCCCCW